MSKLIRTNSETLLNIIDDIIEISRIESGNMNIVSEDIEVNTLMDELNATNTILKNSLNKQHLQLVSKNDCDELWIKSDKHRLIQALNNLISNALKYTSDGIVEFGYKLNHEQKLLFYIKDTGIGISEEDKERVFTRFYRGTHEMTNIRGVGLGLSISKQIIELLGGRLWFESEQTKGSVFYIEIPLIKSSHKKFPEIQSNKTYNLNNKPILIAEDDDANFYLAEIMLSELDIKVIRAVNGKEAVEIIENNDDIDLILMDIKMPVMDGIQATRIIKQLKKDVKIIALTAHVFEEVRNEARDAGCEDFISKPIDKDKLFECLSAK